jgi:hypothetical protein
MPMIWKSEKLSRVLRPGELDGICILALEKAGLNYFERSNSDSPVYDVGSGLTVAQCRTKNKERQDEILARPPINVRIRPEELEPYIHKQEEPCKLTSP